MARHHRVANETELKQSMRYLDISCYTYDDDNEVEPTEPLVECLVLTYSFQSRICGGRGIELRGRSECFEVDYEGQSLDIIESLNPGDVFPEDVGFESYSYRRTGGPLETPIFGELTRRNGTDVEYEIVLNENEVWSLLVHELKHSEPYSPFRAPSVTLILDGFSVASRSAAEYAIGRLDDVRASWNPIRRFQPIQAVELDPRIDLQLARQILIGNREITPDEMINFTGCSRATIYRYRRQFAHHVGRPVETPCSMREFRRGILKPMLQSREGGLLRKRIAHIVSRLGVLPKELEGEILLPEVALIGRQHN